MPFQFTQGGLCVPPFVDGVRQYKPRKRAAGVTAVGGEFRRGGQPAGLVGELGLVSRQGPTGAFPTGLIRSHMGFTGAQGTNTEPSAPLKPARGRGR